MSRFYLTTAIVYANSRPHLGTAYEKIAADVIARYKRLCGVETHFVMGNDKNSQNGFLKARDISFDGFLRTTEPRPRAGVQEFVRRMSGAGDVYEGHYEGWYCVSCE